MEHRNRAAVAAELERRVQAYLTRTEIEINYYRIGYRLSFSLPVAARPTDLPVGVLGSDRPYPWLIWLGWELEERWRVFALAIRVASDWGISANLDRVHRALTDELIGLSRWESYDADYNGAGLVTSSMAAVCNEIVRYRDHHRPETVTAAENVGNRILDESVAPWYAETWHGIDPAGLGPDGLHNIRCITLLRAAQLADALSHPATAGYQSKAYRLYRAWLAARADPEPMTEGTAYDGFLLDSLTDWLADRPDADELRAQGRAALSAFPVIAAALTLPGRPERQAPIGDVEPEMTQWASAALRLRSWYPETAAATTALGAFPITHLAGWALPFAPGPAANDEPPELEAGPPGAGPLGVALQPATATLRRGWSPADPLVAVSAARTPAGHLQTDGGTLVLGRNGRWWITDPGYQQYRQGSERDFTIGPQSHNAPVINGKAQTIRNVVARPCAGPDLRVELDLTGCYSDLGPGARVARTVLLGDCAVLVTDRFGGLGGADLQTHWHADAELAWSFVEGVARLTDGACVLWLAGATSAGRLTFGADQLTRHPGTSGPLRLSPRTVINADGFVAWWAFLFSDDLSWSVPTHRLDHLLGLGDLRG